MTHRDGTRATRERLYSEAYGVIEEDGLEQENWEFGEGGQGGGDSAAVAGAVTAPDGGWGWVVLVATIVVLALTLAFPSCIGIFYVDLQQEFLASNSETSWVPSIMTSMLHAGGPFCSVLVNRFGCRATVMLGGVLSGLGMAASSFTQSISQLYLTAGIITGLGFSFSFQPAVTILGHYFVRRRAFANAISSTGTALGICILPFLGNYLLTEFGWRGSFLVLGAVLLNCCVCGAVMRPLHPPQHRSQSPPLRQKTEKGCLSATWSCVLASLGKHMAFDQLCNNSRYLAYAICITWTMLGFVVPLVYLVPYATANNIEPGKAALLLSILGIVNAVVRPPFAVLFNTPWFKERLIYVYAVALMVNGLSNSICCIGPSFYVLLSFAVVYGVSMSVVGSLMFTVLMDIVEMRRFPSALGLVAIMESITLLIGPPLAGILVDRTGHYFPVFFACCVVVASSGVFVTVSFCWLDKRDRKSSKQGQPSAQSEALRAAADVAPGCQYHSVPTEGDKDKASDNGAERITSL